MTGGELTQLRCTH